MICNAQLEVAVTTDETAAAVLFAIPQPAKEMVTATKAQILKNVLMKVSPTDVNYFFSDEQT
jgi:hypothetical protein